MQYGKNSRWDQTRLDATNPVVVGALPETATMTQAQFFKPREKTEAQKMEEQRKLAEKLRGR